ncbi:DUF6325 family protein [Saccharomonospora sp. NPDC046836]|uniref:DUF6325 family protein n=1 Tax=Saccharomonospora sp. NPDC046836 TaxID=3156921 RepID=UPI0033E87797
MTTRTPADTAELDELGPIDYLVIEFPAGGPTGKAMPLLLDLVERGIVRVLDLEFLSISPDGTITRVAVEDLGGDEELELTVFAGAKSGLLDEDDLQEAAAALEPDTSAAILVYENLWAAPLARELRRSGAQLVAGGRIPVQAVLAALDATENAE